MTSIYKNIRVGLVLLAGLLVCLTGCDKKAASSASKSTFVVADEFRHPLDPLDTNEIKSVKEILLASGKMDTNQLLFLINLHEPPKAEILAYQAGQPFRREAFVCSYNYDKNLVSESVVDLKAKKVLSFKTVSDVQPGTFEKDSIINDVLKKDSGWVAALKKRNIAPDSVRCWGQFVGELGMAPKSHRELIGVPSYKNKKYKSLPIAGLYAFVDMTDRKVVKIIDEDGKYTTPTDIGYFNADSAKVR
nr:hypothetical protein [Cytophagales bacterium]